MSAEIEGPFKSHDSGFESLYEVTDRHGLTVARFYFTRGEEPDRMRALANARRFIAQDDLLGGYSALRCAACGISPSAMKAASGCPECAPARAAIAKGNGAP